MPPPAEGLAPRLIVGPALRTQPDRRLVKLVRGGYEQAFDEIVRRYGRPLARYAATIVGSRSEDVTQDAFSKALLALRRDGAEIELRPWLYRIVRNTALNDLRDRPPTAELADTVPASGGPAEQVEQREELVELTRRLQALPDPQRAAIVMRELEGLGHEEIAAALGMSGGAARQAIYRARAALRDGFGMLVPLPLIRALLSEDLSRHAEVATGAVGSAGTGVALKATAATLLVAGTVGAGVVLHNGPAPTDAAATARAARASRPGAGRAGDGSGPATSLRAPDTSAQGGAGHRTGGPSVTATPGGRSMAVAGTGLTGSAGSGHSGDGQSGSSGHDGGSQTPSTSGGEHSGSGTGESGSGSGSSSGSGDSGSGGSSGSGDSLSGGSSGSGDSGSGTSSGSGDGSGSSEPSGSSDGGSTETTESTSDSSSGSGSGSGSGSTLDGSFSESRDSSGAAGLTQEMSPFQ